MSPSITIRLLLVAVLVVLCLMSGSADAQSVPLIYACVDAQGRLTIVPAGGRCGNRETLLTWPAEPTGGVSYYQRSAAARTVNIPTTVAALCDAPEDTATGGGYRWEPDPVTTDHGLCWVQASASCRASGFCGGQAGEDGWAVIAWNCHAATQAPVLHVYVTCSQS